MSKNTEEKELLSDTFDKKTLHKDPMSLTLDDPEEEEHSKLKKFTTSIKVSVGVAVAADIAITALTGHAAFFGGLNQLAEAKVHTARGASEAVKTFGETTVGSTFKNVLKFFGHPATKRIFRMTFATTALIAAGALSAGTVPLIAFGLSAGATIINSVRDYKAQRKMENNVKRLEKLTKLKKLHLQRKALFEKLGIDQSLGKEFLLHEDSLKITKPKKPPLFERAAKRLLPEKIAKKAIENTYMRELGSTIFFNATECAAAAMSGEFLTLATTATIGITSENKERTEHTELKRKIRNTMRKDLDDIGLEGQEFKSDKELELALEKQQFLSEQITATISADGFADQSHEEQKRKINDVINNIGLNFEKHKREQTEKAQEEWGKKTFKEKAKSVFSSIGNNKVISIVKGYFRSWNPRSDKYNPEKIGEELKEKREDLKLSTTPDALSKHLERVKQHPKAPEKPCHKEQTTRIVSELQHELQEHKAKQPGEAHAPTQPSKGKGVEIG